MYQGMVALNPAPYTLGTLNPYQLIHEVVVAGAHIKVQATLPGMTDQEIIRAAHRSNVPSRPLIILNDRKIDVEIGSSIETEINQRIEKGFGETTVVVNQDSMPELKAIAKRSPNLFVHMVAVCVLTSQTNAIIREYHGVSRIMLMKRRMQFALDIGFTKCVCGIPEVRPIRHTFKTYRIERFYTPGTRLPGDPVDDQEIVGTPQEAHEAGAIWIAGRPIANNPKPGLQYKKYANIINAATP